MNEIDKLYAERAALIATADTMFAASKADGGKWGAEEQEKFDRVHDDADAVLAKIDTAKKAVARVERHEAARASLTETRGRSVPAGQPGATGGSRNVASVQFRGREIRFREGSAEARRCTPEYAASFNAYLGGDNQAMAALTTDIGQDGGYLAPPQYVAELVKELDNSFWMRKLCRVLPPTNAPKITMPKRTARMNAFAWGSEVSTPNVDTGIKFGSYELTPHYMTAEIEISNDLIQAGSLSVEGIVRDEILYASAEIEEKAFCVGDGVNKPLGVFVPSIDGIPSGRDVTGPANAFETFMDAKYSLREPYLRSDALRWLFNRLAIRDLSKLKATTGEPLWVVSVREGQPETFLGTPVVLSEYAPKGTTAVTFAYASGDYVGMIGDFRQYDILDGLDMGIKRHMDSYYDRRNMTGYVVRRKVDGNARIGEGFARVVKQ